MRAALSCYGVLGCGGGVLVCGGRNAEHSARRGRCTLARWPEFHINATYVPAGFARAMARTPKPLPEYEKDIPILFIGAPV